MTRPAPPTSGDGDVVEMDALNLEEWEGAQHTPEVNDAKLEALVKQTVAAPAPEPGSKSRTKTQAMPHVVMRPPAPPGATKPLPIPTEIPIAVPFKRTATSPVGVPALPVAKKRATPAADVPAPPVARKLATPPAGVPTPASAKVESSKLSTLIDQEESEGWSLPTSAEDDWTEVGTTLSVAPAVRAAAKAGQSLPAPPVQPAVPKPVVSAQTRPLPQVLKPVAPVQAPSRPQPEIASPPPPIAAPQPVPQAAPQFLVEPAEAQTKPQPVPQAAPQRVVEPAEAQTKPQPQPLPLPPPPSAAGTPPRQPSARMPTGPAPSDEAIPALRDERHEQTDAHRLRFKRRAVIVAVAVLGLIVLVVLVARRGPSTSTAARPPAPGATAVAPTGATPSTASTVDPPSESPPPSEPPPATDTTDTDLDTTAAAPATGKHARHTSSSRTRVKPTTSTGHTGGGTTEPAADDGDKRERARAAYSTGNDKLFAGDALGAIRAYRESTKLGYVAGYRGLGLAYAQAGDRAHARDAFETYLSRSPNAKDAALIKKRLAALK